MILWNLIMINKLYLYLVVCLFFIFNLLNGEISEIENRNFMVPIESFKNSFSSSKDFSLSEETVALTPSGVRMIVPLIFLLEQ